MSMNPRNIQPIIGSQASWGLLTSAASAFRPQPFQYTPGATDTMQVRVREKIDIYGVGMDVIEMVGTFIVERDHPRLPQSAKQPQAEPIANLANLQWGQAEVKATFLSLDLVGDSQLFGTVRAHLDPTQVANATVSPASEGSLAAACAADLYPQFELPEMNLKLGTSGQPIKLASKVVQIPPVGDVARSENSVQLTDESGKVIGELVSSDIEVGNVLFSIPLGATERRTG